MRGGLPRNIRYCFAFGCPSCGVEPGELCVFRRRGCILPHRRRRELAARAQLGQVGRAYVARALHRIRDRRRYLAGTGTSPGRVGTARPWLVPKGTSTGS